MQPLPKYDHIEGLEGRVPVGAVLTVGTKGPSGNPIENDRFFFKSPYPDTKNSRPLHPEFSAWNSADPSKRVTVRGHLGHNTQAECFEYALRAQVLRPPAHPNMIPHCTGDGITATRWAVAGGEWASRQMDCPNRLCEFRQGQKPACKPSARFYFYPRWNQDPPTPPMLVKLASQSWNSIANLLGFFEEINHNIQAMGLEGVSLYGLPFVLNLTRKTNAAQKTAFPVITISLLVDLVDFLAKQRGKLLEAGGLPRQLVAAGPMTPSESTPEEVALDLATINPGIPTKPAHVVEPEPIEEAEIVETGPPALSRDRLEYIQEQGRRLGLSLSDIEQAWGHELMTATVNDETEILSAIAKRGRKAR